MGQKGIPGIVHFATIIQSHINIIDSARTSYLSLLTYRALSFLEGTPRGNQGSLLAFNLGLTLVGVWD